jgi:hypothetical protein
VTRFRNPGAREAAFGRYYAKRGAAVVVTRSDRAPYPSERLSEWKAKYHALPVSAQLGERHV